jgi:uncharacterized integral membrane protein
LFKVIIAALFIVLLATFSTSNREEIFLRYFGWSTGSFPLFILLLASLVAGMILGFSVDWGERWKLRAKARDLEKRAEAIRDEIEGLTAPPKPPESPSPPPDASEKTHA